MDFGPVTSTLTIEASYSQLTYLADCEFQGTIVLLPVNVQTLAEFTFGKYSKMYTHIITVLKNIF